ncbi:unnamed protein product [Rotaria sordida]|uniref:Uncharacterized protein n=1 Tax=Rotaria sordida TaxID=392033 RepID=A0A814TG64_9BILA|nr:unnamed protein product [Rotaria sordida]
MEICDPSNAFINMILRTLNPEQIVSLRLNNNSCQTSSQLHSLIAFSNITSLNLLNFQQLDSINTYQTYFPKLKHLALWYDNENKDLPPIDYWIDKMDEKDNKSRYQVQHMIANGSYTSSIEKHAIFSAFLFAYNSHEGIVLCPDDIWLMICIYFSQYVNDNAEQLRILFVDDYDRKRLTVRQTARIEPDWNDFLERMRVEISQNMKTDVAEMLTSNFSTTTNIESLLSCVAIMDTFQKKLHRQAKNIG